MKMLKVSCPTADCRWTMTDDETQVDVLAAWFSEHWGEMHGVPDPIVDFIDMESVDED